MDLRHNAYILRHLSMILQVNKYNVTSSDALIMLNDLLYRLLLTYCIQIKLRMTLIVATKIFFCTFFVDKI